MENNGQLFELNHLLLTIRSYPLFQKVRPRLLEQKLQVRTLHTVLYKNIEFRLVQIVTIVTFFFSALCHDHQITVAIQLLATNRERLVTRKLRLRFISDQNKNIRGVITNKTGRTVQYGSFNEFKLTLILERDPTVLDYISQPETFEFFDD